MACKINLFTDYLSLYTTKYINIVQYVRKSTKTLFTKHIAKKVFNTISEQIKGYKEDNVGYKKSIETADNEEGNSECRLGGWAPARAVKTELICNSRKLHYPARVSV